jgi:hypothetical protein
MDQVAEAEVAGGGPGRPPTRWITTDDPEVDITTINVDRFHPCQCNPEFRTT